jgi:hypothetical protein
MLGVFALVLSISETQDYLGKLINVYRVVKLQVPQVHCNSQGEGGTKSDFQFIYLILYDGQVGISGTVLFCCVCLSSFLMFAVCVDWLWRLDFHWRSYLSLSTNFNRK